MRSASPLGRAACAVVLALLLALRSLAPAGFMPAFEHGRIAIVICPDAEPIAAMPPMAHHDHRQHDKLHQPCPFAAASATGALDRDLVLLLDALILAGALLLGRALVLPVRNVSQVRPPSRGPPLPA
jgi:hypothetical protein